MVKAKITENGIKLDDELLQKLKTARLSVSAVEKIKQCPASWVATRSLVGDLVPLDPSSAAFIGSLFHEILQTLFTLPPEERTKEKLENIKKSVIQNPFANTPSYQIKKHYLKGFEKVEGLPDLKDFPEVIDSLNLFLDNYFIKMGSDPKKVNIAVIRDEKGNEKKGLEYGFYNIDFKGINFKFTGFVDRIQEISENTLLIEDYKTGSYKSKTPGTGQFESFSEIAQLVTYAFALRKLGYQVKYGRLIMPAIEKTMDFDLTDKDIENRVLAEMKASNDKLVDSIKSNLFEFQESSLCPWCPFVNACPRAKIGTKQNAIDSMLKQPSVEEMKQSEIFE